MLTIATTPEFTEINAFKFACETRKVITYSEKGDTAATVAQVRASNAERADLCKLAQSVGKQR